MDAFLPLIAGLGGAVFGAGLVWMIHRSLARTIKEKADAEAKAEYATAYERLRAAEQRLVAHETDAKTLQGRFEALNKAYTEITGRLSGAEASLAGERKKVEEREERIGKLQAEIRERDDKIDLARRENSELNAENSKLRTAIEKEQEKAAEKLALLAEAEVKLSDVFKSLSAQALQTNNATFLDLAKENLQKFQQVAQGDLETRQKAIDQLVKPLNESLVKINTHLGEAEKSRSTTHTQLSEQLRSMSVAQETLKTETAKLVRALRSPTTRGRWGEIQLRRVAEMAGMIEHCDFVQQETAHTEDGKLRPDMIVRLPNRKNVVVDAKVSLQAYLDALEAQDEAAKMTSLKDHARQLRDHIKKLSAKEYWNQFAPTPEFVVLFLPGESFFSAALEQDPALLELGVESNVLIASPTTLIALLRAVAYGWREEQLAENAQLISELGQQLYERIRKLAEHFDDVRKGLAKATESYNKAVGTLETRVLVSARRFKDLGASRGGDIEVMDRIDIVARQVETDELPALPGPNGDGA